MLTRAVVLIAVLCVSLLLPAAAGQEHHMDGAKSRVLVLHDAPADGRALVGSLTHFGFALVGPDGAPIVHQDSHVTLSQNGHTLFDTKSTHEYDGLFSLDWTFTEPGAYVVAVEQLDDAGKVLAANDFMGVAVTPEGANTVKVNVTMPKGASTGAPTEFALTIANASTGAMVPHSDALVEIRRTFDAQVVLRAHLHAHEKPMSFRYGFQMPGEYSVSIIGFNAYPSANGTDYRAAIAHASLTVAPGLPVPAAAENPGIAATESIPSAGLVKRIPSSAIQALPKASPGSADPAHNMSNMASMPTLFVTRDPTPLSGQAVAGPFTQVRLSGLVYDNVTRDALAHVNFKAALAGPTGDLFASESLHEYDGHYELMVAGLAPGQYSFGLEASKKEWKKEGALAFNVLPPVVPLSVGPFMIAMKSAGAPRALEPTDLVFSSTDAAGQPLAHVENDLTILDAADAVPLANFKIHTHDDGVMSARVAFPHAGKWTILVDPTSLEPRPSYVVGPAGPGKPILFTVNVLPANATIGDVVKPLSTDGAAKKFAIPGAEAALALAAVGVALAARRGRRS